MKQEDSLLETLSTLLKYKIVDYWVKRDHQDTIEWAFVFEKRGVCYFHYDKNNDEFDMHHYAGIKVSFLQLQAILAILHTLAITFSKKTRLSLPDWFDGRTLLNAVLQSL